MTRHTRREFLTTIGAASMAAIGGCSGEDESTAEAEEEEEEEQQDEERDEDASSEYDGEFGQPPVEIHVDYWASWSGSVGTESRQVSVDGRGPRTMTIDGYPEVVSATIQKQDDYSDELLVEIAVDGEVVASQGTYAEYGVVSLSVQI